MKTFYVKSSQRYLKFDFQGKTYEHRTSNVQVSEDSYIEW